VRNNVALLLPDYKLNPYDANLMYPESFKQIIGSEPNNIKDYLKSLLRLYKVILSALSDKRLLTEIFGEEDLGFVEKRLKELRDNAEKYIYVTIYSMLRRLVIGKRRLSYEIQLRPLGEARDLSWFAGEVEELLEKVGVLTTWSWLDVYNQLRHMEEIWDHSDRSVKKPVKVRDLWYQLLNSESVHPHITSFSDFENALRDAYENNEIAFRYGSQLIWLRHHIVWMKQSSTIGVDAGD